MTILTFGIAKEIVGTGTLELPFSEISNKETLTVTEIKQFLIRKYPELKKLSSLAIAVNSQYAKEADKIRETDEIALIPPVSGG